MCKHCVSEFKQLDHVLDLSTSPEDYLQIVRGKTAGPFAAVCESAAIIAGASQEQSQALGRFGMELGIAFQLMDDLLDLRGDERMGKPRGKDVIEGKMTLPLIHALTLLHGDDDANLLKSSTISTMECGRTHGSPRDVRLHHVCRIPDAHTP